MANVGHNRIMIENDNITVGGNSYEKMNNFKNLGFLFTNKNSIHEDRKFMLLFSPNTLIFTLKILK